MVWLSLFCLFTVEEEEDEEAEAQKEKDEGKVGIES